MAIPGRAERGFAHPGPNAWALRGAVKLAQTLVCMRAFADHADLVYRKR